MRPQVCAYFTDFRFNLHKSWSTTAFILNLAFGDLLYCILNFSHWVMLSIHKKWDFGKPLCKIIPVFLNANVCSCFMSVAMIAISRLIMINNIGKPTLLFSKRNQVMIIISIRIYGFVVCIPTIFGVSMLRKRCFTFTQHFKVKCDFGTQFFGAVLVAQGIRAMGFKHAY